MRGFFRSNTFKILLIVVFIFSGILVLSNTVGNSSIASVFGIVLKPMQQVSSSVADEELDKYSTMDREELEIYSNELAKENAILRAQLVEYYDLKEKNKQYEQALNIKNSYPEWDMTPASVIAKDPTDPFMSFTIDLGYLDGIAVNDPVISENGLVGVVSQCFAVSSVVTTIFSEDLMLGAVAKETNESAVLKGDALAAASNAVKLDYISRETKIDQGDIIASSGAGGMFPENIPIGTVISLKSNESDVSMYALVLPFEDIKNINSVFVITNFPEKNSGTEAQEDLE